MERGHQSYYNCKIAWRNTTKYKYYGRESFYNLYTVLMAEVIEHPFPLEIGIFHYNNICNLQTSYGCNILML